MSTASNQAETIIEHASLADVLAYVVALEDMRGLDTAAPTERDFSPSSFAETDPAPARRTLKVAA